MSGDIDVMSETQMVGARYRPGKLQVETSSTRKTVQRASRTTDQPLVRRTADYVEPSTRGPRPTQQQSPRRMTQAYQQQRPIPDVATDMDVEVAPSVRTRSERPAPPTRQLPPMREHQGPYSQGHTKAITIGVGATIAVMWLAWLLSTSGASFWATHVTDSATYGPMHGNVVTGVFGGGDSTEHPTKLLALNNGGRVEIIKITADDPKKTQIIAGPDLVASSFPDPTQAEIELRVDGPDVTVTIYGSAFVLPFHRSSQFVVLHSDGKGNLKPKTGGQ